MQTFTKNKLSGSIDGVGILVTQAATLGSPIHTAVAGTSSFDEVWLYASNSATSAIELTVEWGGPNNPSASFATTIPSRSGRTLIVDGRLINNGRKITAFSNPANYIAIDGFINQITP